MVKNEGIQQSQNNSKLRYRVEVEGGMGEGGGGGGAKRGEKVVVVANITSTTWRSVMETRSMKSC